MRESQPLLSRMFRHATDLMDLTCPSERGVTCPYLRLYQLYRTNPWTAAVPTEFMVKNLAGETLVHRSMGLEIPLGFMR